MNFKTKDQIIADRVLYVFLGVLAVGLLLPIAAALWFISIPVGLVLLYLWWKRLSHTHERASQLEAIIKSKNRKHKGDACIVEDSYGLIEQVGIQTSAESQMIFIDCTTLVKIDRRLRVNRGHTVLIPVPQSPSALANEKQFAGLLKANGIEILNDLSVESKAVKSLVDHYEQAVWMYTAVEQLEDALRGIDSTLSAADGNELLEPSIPGLVKAKSDLNEELAKLQNAQSESSSQLKKLIDFLAVPKNVRPILNYEVDDLCKHVDLSGLKDSCSQVVELNEAYVRLCREGPFGS